MKLIVPAGTTSKLVRVFIQDSSATDGSGLTGLAYDTSGLVAYYIREGAASAVKIDSGGATALVDMTVGTWTSCGFKEVDATNMPGLYELGLPDAVLAAGAGSAVVMLHGASDMAPCVLEIQLDVVANLLSALACLLPSDYEDVAGHGSFANILAYLSGCHKVTASDNEDGTEDVQLYKANGSDAWGVARVLTIAAGADDVTGVNDTA